MNKNQMSPLFSGIKAMMPIMTGVIPFGLVMGTAGAASGLSLWESSLMNLAVFAGASQLSSLDLLAQNVSIPIVVLTGLIINLRFLLYSAGLSPYVQNSHPITKLLIAYFLTDQSYAVFVSHQKNFKSISESLKFYFGASLIMATGWHLAIVLGHFFGNFAPPSLSLDFAVPLSFVALIVPTLINKKYLAVMATATFLSILLHPLPYNLGLVVAAGLSVTLGALLTNKKRGSHVPS